MFRIHKYNILVKQIRKQQYENIRSGLENRNDRGPKALFLKAFNATHVSLFDFAKYDLGPVELNVTIRRLGTARVALWQI